METYFILKLLGMTISRGNVVSYMRVIQPATSTSRIAQYLLEGGSDLMLQKNPYSIILVTCSIGEITIILVYIMDEMLFVGPRSHLHSPD